MSLKEVSQCCGEPVIAMHGTEICSHCNLECLVEQVCADCMGTGYLPVDEDDGEGHITAGTGSKPCHCQE